MVQEEVRVARRRVEVAARVSADPEVAAGVHAEVASWEVSLHSVLEADDVGAVGEELVCERHLLVMITVLMRQLYLQLIASVEPLAAPAFERSRRKQRSFRPSPSA